MGLSSLFEVTFKLIWSQQDSNIHSDLGLLFGVSPQNRNGHNKEGMVRVCKWRSAAASQLPLSSPSSRRLQNLSANVLVALENFNRSALDDARTRLNFQPIRLCGARGRRFYTLPTAKLKGHISSRNWRQNSDRLRTFFVFITI
ncbi:hypothetical protein DV515_00008409 [Chloebia gouldiae]|uniref:Uncharacterized protein n=1 Tax=Chloebia gouldiae TaxID=44316 RepID=A0A3L8SFS4_CHLGU|nr:hypothetical protein DV515_00008409 [Chloebia gouldiae]